MKITAVVPVRKGSVRVKNKNLKPFAGSNLLKIKLEPLKAIQSIDEIVVSSDCDEMLKIAEDCGVKTHSREKYYASSDATNSEFFKNLAESIDCEHFLYAPVTCPLISNETYYECISKYKQGKMRNIVTVAPVKHHMWLDGKPLNYDVAKSPNSQDLPDIYQITYGICIIEKGLMTQSQNVVSQNPKFYVLDEIESVDIDTEFDFMITKMVYKKIHDKIS